MAHRERYTHSKFFQALAPQALTGAATTGVDVDTEGFNALTFVINVGNSPAAGSWLATEHLVGLQHAAASTAGGAGTYTDVGSQYILMSGANTATASGLFLSIASETFLSNAFAVGYIGPKRYVRLRFSATGTPSVLSFAGALAVLGYPEDWPVNKVGA